MVVEDVALWGTVIGAIFGGFTNELLGKKKLCFGWVNLYSISANEVLQFRQIQQHFAFLDLLEGVGIGISTIAAPVIYLRNFGSE